MAMTQDAVVSAIGDSLFSMWSTERQKLDRIDRWARWDHDDPHKPRHATPEYKELAARAQAPWGDLIVSSIAQTLYVEGYRRPEEPKDSAGWDNWQANGMDGRQVAINRSVLTYGLTYGTVLPGKNQLTGVSMPVMRGVSPREMIAVYEDPANDDWPTMAMRVRPKKGTHLVDFYDDELVHHLEVGSVGDTPKWISSEAHNVGVPPVVRWKNRFDLEGRCVGEIEPFIPLLGRIDQTTFDRLVVQRFCSWIVRTIAGMSVTDSAAATGSTVEQVKMKLKAEDFLTAEDPDTKFGSLPATSPDGFIKAREADLTDLAAVSQTPAFEILGGLSNLSADALAAAKSSQDAKSDERRHTYGEDYEQFIRLGSHVAGDEAGAMDFGSQVRWADTSIRSLSQAADALGKLVTMLGIPPEILWSKVPGLTQQDIDEAKEIVEKEGGMGSLMAKLLDQATPGDLPEAA